MGRVLHRLPNAVLSAIDGATTRRAFILHMLRDSIKLEYRPEYLIEVVYGWCSVIYKNHGRLQDWESLLFACLEIGFRHLDFRTGLIKARLTHTEHHRGLADVVFKSQQSESIADLLHAWTSTRKYDEPAHELLDFCPAHLVGLHNLVPFSPRLRRLIIRSVELIGHKGFEGVGVEGFIGLLNHLHVTAEDVDHKFRWADVLLDTIRSSEETQHLSHWYWEFLVEFAASEPRWVRPLSFTHDLQIITSLTEAKEWSKLESWMGIFWTFLPGRLDLGKGGPGHSMTLLFRQRPGAVQRLEQWMERWSQGARKDIPESFKKAHEQAREAAQRDGP